MKVIIEIDMNGIGSEYYGKSLVYAKAEITDEMFMFTDIRNAVLSVFRKPMIHCMNVYNLTRRTQTKFIGRVFTDCSVERPDTMSKDFRVEEYDITHAETLTINK